MSYFLNLSTLNQSLIMFSFYLFHQRANLTRVNNTLERNESYHHVKTTLAKESKSCDQNDPPWFKGTPLSCHIKNLEPLRMTSI